MGGIRNWAPAMGWAVQGLGRSWRFGEFGRLDQSPIRRRRDGPAIFALWHNRMLPAFYMYRHLGIRALISPSQDGDWLVDIVQRLGFGAARGSTRQSPVGAVRQVLGILADGHDVAITPDGPLGPPYRVQAGVVFLAKRSGCPIIPFSFDCTSKWTLKSWDRFMIPKPFCRGAFVWGEPIQVEPEVDEGHQEEFRRLVEDRLNDLTDQATRLT